MKGMQEEIKASSRGLTRAMVTKLPPSEREHFMRCPTCRFYFDCRDLAQVAAHCFLKQHDAATPEAKKFEGKRGRPITVRDYRVIPIGETKAITEEQLAQRRKARKRAKG
jgi:hypothetical protein